MTQQRQPQAKYKKFIADRDRGYFALRSVTVASFLEETLTLVSLEQSESTKSNLLICEESSRLTKASFAHATFAALLPARVGHSSAASCLELCETQPRPFSPSC